MKHVHNRTTAAFLGMALGLVIALVVVPALMPNDAPVKTRGYEDLAVRPGGKGLDKGMFELWSIGGGNPMGWVLSDDTTDGAGTEYHILHTATYVFPSPSNPNTSVNIVYDASGPTSSLQDAINYIVNNNAHVSSAADLTVHEHAVSLN